MNNLEGYATGALKLLIDELNGAEIPDHLEMIWDELNGMLGVYGHDKCLLALKTFELGFARGVKAESSALSIDELKALGNDLADIHNTMGIQKQMLSFMNLSMMKELEPQVLESLGVLADSIESHMEKIDHIAALLLENDKPEEVKALK